MQSFQGDTPLNKLADKLTLLWSFVISSGPVPILLHFVHTPARNVPQFDTIL